MKLKTQIEDRANEKYGQWTVIRRSNPWRQGYYWCTCKCGRVSSLVNIRTLTGGHSSKCSRCNLDRAHAARRSLTTRDVQRILRIYGGGVPIGDVARRMGLDYSKVSRVVHRIGYAHVRRPVVRRAA